MPKFKISNEYISKCNDTEISEYPKYTTQVINLANQNAGGTRPRNIGQLSELLPEYLSSPGEASLSGWKEWYNERYPDAVNNAVDRVWDQVNNLRDCMDYIDKDRVQIDFFFHFFLGHWNIPFFIFSVSAPSVF